MKKAKQFLHLDFSVGINWEHQYYKNSNEHKKKT
jgi:hypothetical protein